MTRLIVHSDDFGLSSAVNRGVARAHTEGILTSASLLPNAPAFDEAVALLRELPDLGVGIELNVVRGRPLTPPAQVPSLVVGARFPGDGARVLGRALRGRLAADDLERELEAQVQRVLGAGVRATHVCGEKHCHLYPGVAAIAARVARRHGIWRYRSARLGTRHLAGAVARAPDGGALVRYLGLRASAALGRRRYEALGLSGPDRLHGLYETGRVGLPLVRELLAALGPGTHELMTHVGEPGESPAEMGRYRIDAGRPRELAALCTPGLREAARAAGVELCHYGALAQGAGA